jgi:hypothetical protein
VLVELLLTFALKEGLVWFAVFLVEVDRCGDVEVVEEAGDVEEYGVTVLRIFCQHMASITTIQLTSVTPNSLTAGFPPFRTLSSASIC